MLVDELSHIDFLIWGKYGIGSKHSSVIRIFFNEIIGSNLETGSSSKYIRKIYNCRSVEKSDHSTSCEIKKYFSSKIFFLVIVIINLAYPREIHKGRIVLVSVFIFGNRESWLVLPHASSQLVEYYSRVRWDDRLPLGSFVLNAGQVGHYLFNIDIRTVAHLLKGGVQKILRKKLVSRKRSSNLSSHLKVEMGGPVPFRFFGGWIPSETSFIFSTTTPLQTIGRTNGL